jgi:phospholipid-transporting ATPase
MSQIELKVNYILGIILLIQVILCLVVAIFDGFFIANNRDKHTYIAFGSYSTVLDAFLIGCSYFVLVNTMIPISLIVSI